jgi:hypothetical protein
MKLFIKYLATLIFLLWVGIASADIYRCLEEENVVTLSNLESSKKSKNCTKMVLPKKSFPKPANGSQSEGAPGTAGVGNSTGQVAPSTPKDKSAERKRIISSEIELEAKRLAEVKKKIQDLSNNPSILLKGSDELSKLYKVSAAHQKNIELLKFELSK